MYVIYRRYISGEFAGSRAKLHNEGPFTESEADRECAKLNSKPFTPLFFYRVKIT